MKKLIALALIIGTTTLTQAQNNLVFNRVLNFRLADEVPVTVPEGKVWKIEASANLTNFTIYSNDITPPYGLAMDSSNSGSLNLFSSEFAQTVWVAEGYSIVHRNGSNNFVSILEFNVVPTSSSSVGSGGGGVSSDGFAAIGIVNIQFNDSRAGIDNHLMGTITVPEGEIWKITDASILRSSIPFGSFNNGGNYLMYDSTYTFIGTHQFPNPNGQSHRTARYLTEGSYEVRSWEANGLNTSPTSATNFYQAMINGIKYSAN